MTTKNELTKCVSGKSNLVRPRFSPGLLLQDDDLTLAIDYIGNLSRLMFSSLFGCGVICGFKIGTETKCGLQITVDKGLALDCRGDPVQLPSGQTLTPGDCRSEEEMENELWVAIRRKECLCAPRDAVCAPEEEDQASQVATRIRDGFELKLFDKPEDCFCGCVSDVNDEEPEDPAGEGGEEAPGEVATAAKMMKAPAKKSAKGKKQEAAAKPAAAASAAAEQARPVAALALNEGGDEPSVYVGPDDKCYQDHYNGICACECCCEWVVLGRVYPKANPNGVKEWKVDYSVRRFIRPVLARFPKDFPPAP